jgi:peptidyl-prolyl cis-trans isomerase C
MAQASARHILVSSQQECELLKQKILSSETTFEATAQKVSQCPSGKQGGNLGSFAPGMMVPEFDKVVFSAPIGEVQGPVQTQFGYHLIEVTERSE